MRNRSDLEKWLGRYDLAIDKIQDVDLRCCYMQQRPNNSFDSILRKHDESVDYHLLNSPHYELAQIYINQGPSKTKEVFRSTKYYLMGKMLGKSGFPGKIDDLIKSLSRGYLSHKHKWAYIVILNEPFARSRYNRDVPNLCPEIWSGHHRGGILLAMEKYIVPVVMAKDMKPGCRKSVGKIHGLCVEK
jgi:hypothetical protein